MDDIKLFAKNEKELEILIQTVRIHSDDIGILFVREKCLANNEKRKTTNYGKNRTTKSRQNQNTQRKENLQILGNFENGYHQTSGDNRKT